MTAIEGEFGETVALNEAVPAAKDSQTWLNVLEKSMKTSLMMNFTKCLISTRSRTKDETIVSDFVKEGTVGGNRRITLFILHCIDQHQLISMRGVFFLSYIYRKKKERNY